MNRLEEIKEILTEDLILCNITHENAPPHRDCLDDCDVLKDNKGKSLGEHGKTKHRRCRDCWDEYIETLATKIEKVKEAI